MTVNLYFTRHQRVLADPKHSETRQIAGKGPAGIAGPPKLADFVETDSRVQGLPKP